MYILKSGSHAVRILSSGHYRAGEILCRYLSELGSSEDSFEYLPDSDVSLSDGDIVLGILPVPYRIPDSDGLGSEGFIIYQAGKDLYIVAEAEQGLVYGVYEFLEKYCGFMFMTSEETYVPECRRLIVPDNTFDKQIPAMEYREVYYSDNWNNDFGEKLKLNGGFKKGTSEENARSLWGFWCHSFFRLIPPDRYFEKSPEWFSLVDGKRINNGQLCCTNDEMIDEAIKNLKVFMDQKPGALYWSVSQNDNAQHCQCEKCRKLDEEAGSPIGSIMYFVNRVAEAFPDKIISTLSYWYSRTAPVQIRLNDNVHIMLCDIECNRSRPIKEDESSASFVNDIRVWEKYCGKMFLWDYDIQFSNLISPFPNLRVLQPNMKFFYESNVRSIFNQANREIGGDMWQLRQYLLAKLSWDPYCDINRYKRDFINAYYGKGAVYVNEYIDKLHDNMERSGEGMSIFGQPEGEAFLSKELTYEYLHILDNGIRAVSGGSGSGVYRRRIEELRLGIVYVILKCGYYGSEEEKRSLKAYFRRTADKVGLVKVEEWKITVKAFLKSI